MIQSLCSAIDTSGPDQSLMDILLDVSRHVAVNKVTFLLIVQFSISILSQESNVPGKTHLDKKKQIPLLYSTMLRQLYLKRPDGLESTKSTFNDTNLIQSVKDMKVTNKDSRSGSEKSLSKGKVREECSCM